MTQLLLYIACCFASQVMRGRGAAAACLSLALPLPKGFGQPAQMGRTGGGAVPKAHWLDDAE